MPYPPTSDAASRPASDARIYVVAYDIRNPRRWRRVFKLMHGYGEWLQLSVPAPSALSSRAAQSILVVDDQARFLDQFARRR